MEVNKENDCTTIELPVWNNEKRKGKEGFYSIEGYRNQKRFGDKVMKI